MHVEINSNKLLISSRRKVDYKVMSMYVGFPYIHTYIHNTKLNVNKQMKINTEGKDMAIS